jgi:acetyl/propionyl-CoA carboxylase alpha subunit
VETGDSVGIHYDPMIAKVIAHGATRQEAIGRLREALSATHIAGLSHNTGYLVRALQTDDFSGGAYTTGFCEHNHDALVINDQLTAIKAAAQATAHFAQGACAKSGWEQADGFTPNLASTRDFRFALNGEHRIASLAVGESGTCRFIHQDLVEVQFRHAAFNHRATVLRTGADLHVMLGGDTWVVRDLDRDIDRFVVSGTAKGGIVAPLPGQVLEVRVRPGDRVRTGDVLVIVEAMKMEHQIRAPEDGTVESVNCTAGSRVEEGVVLVALKAED